MPPVPHLTQVASLYAYNAWNGTYIALPMLRYLYVYEATWLRLHVF